MSGKLLAGGSGILAALVTLAFLGSMPQNARTDDKKAEGDRKETKADSERKYGGFGGSATGGAGKPTVEVNTYQELKTALEKGNAIILVKAPVIEISQGIATSADNITLDGLGTATLRGDKMTGKARQMLQFRGKNLIVRDIHLRNGGDNLEFRGAKKVIVDHVSSTGANGDGITFSQGSQDGTISHCFVAGCIKAVQSRYGDTTRVTVDHCVLLKPWFRAPIMQSVKEFDVRNNLVMDWGQYGSMPFGADCNGNIMGNIYVMSEGATGKKDAAIGWTKTPGKVFFKDNSFRGCSTDKKSTTETALAAPEVVPAYTTDLEALEKKLMSDTEGAGCMPRDATDKAYVAAKTWKVDHDTGFRIPKTG